MSVKEVKGMNVDLNINCYFEKCCCKRRKKIEYSLKGNDYFIKNDSIWICVQAKEMMSEGKIFKKREMKERDKE